MALSSIVQKGRIRYGLGFNLFEIQKYIGGDLIYLNYLLLCHYNPMPHGKKISCRQFCKYLDGRLRNNHFCYGSLQ